MTAHELLSALDVAQEDLLREVDQLRTVSGKKKASPYPWLAVAACLCLLCCGGWFWGKYRSSAPSQPGIQIMDPSTHPTGTASPLPTTHSPTESQSVLPGEELLLWTPYYNEVTEAIDGALRKDVYLFSEELTEEELLSFTPAQRPEWFLPKGYGIFNGAGVLRYIHLVGASSFPETPITISIGTEEPFSCCVLPEEPKVSCCNGVEYTLTRYTAPDGSVTLYGEGKLNGCYYTFSLQGSQETLPQNERDFAQILQAFAGSSVRPEDLSAIHPGEIPVIFDRPLTHEEALALEDYGAYFLSELPVGFSEESIRHYQDPYTAYLSGCWTESYHELSWRVSKLSEEDEARLTHAEEKDRYDLSLYPIPRADSVPEELREVVDNPIFYAEELTTDLIWARAYRSGEQGDSTGWRMEFSVLYNQMVVTVRCKGVDPHWLYTQLSVLSS